MWKKNLIGRGNAENIRNQALDAKDIRCRGHPAYSSWWLPGTLVRAPPHHAVLLVCFPRVLSQRPFWSTLWLGEVPTCTPSKRLPFWMFFFLTPSLGEPSDKLPPNSPAQQLSQRALPVLQHNMGTKTNSRGQWCRSYSRRTEYPALAESPGVHKPLEPV